MAGLKTYRTKRDFSRTQEPRGETPPSRSRNKGLRYVIQKHAARRLHYDLRLELDGVMLSWAVTRGPSLVAGDKRLAIHVEDHPVEYNRFEGTIPQGEYGGGTVMIWDRGTWTPEGDPHRGMKKGHLEFAIHGDKLKGRWHLVRLKPRPGERQEPWLLIKSDDESARPKSARDVLEEKPDSAVSGRSIGEIAEGRSKVWHSNRPAAQQSPRTVSAKAKAAMKAGGRAPPRRKAKAKSRARKTGAAGKRAAQKSPASKPSKPAAPPAGLAATSGARAARLPDFVAPSLATLSERTPAQGRWVHEIKFDGYRMQARLEDGRAALRTRTGLDWTKRFPAIAAAVGALAAREALLDGEIVSGDETRMSDFAALQDDLKAGRQDRLVYYVFDLLHLDGYDLTRAPLLERKARLAGLLNNKPRGDIVRLSEHFEADGPTMLQHACRMNLEGILSKRADAPYRSGRSRNWLKIKCTHSQEFVIAGHEPSDKNGRAIRSLLLAYYEDGDLRYAGRVGTGWGRLRERDLVARLRSVAADRSPFATIPPEEKRRQVKWAEPRLVAEIEFRGWTGGTRVRQGSFKGLREDKPARQVVRETPVMPQGSKPSTGTPVKRAALRRAASPAKRSASAASVAGVALTHPERIYWDDAGVTKADLARYYETVWDRMKPHVTGRVLALVRCPDGQTAQCFYQKHASAGVDATRLHEVKEPGGEMSMSIDDLPGLISLAQAGALEIHVRGSTVGHLEEADRLVFDLDPGPGVAWKEVVEAARAVRARLAKLGLTSFVKSTGGKGLHVVAPIAPARWNEVKAFCRAFAEAMAADEPGRYVATIRKTARKGRIFVDYLRNSREATAIAPYSTRARPGATVSAPLSWEELGRMKTASPFTVATMPRRLARLRRDPWAGIGKLRQRLPASPA